MGYVHVKDRATGHQFAISERRFDPEKHEKTGKPTRNAHDDLVAPKFHVPAKRTKTSAKTAAKSGQTAETDKE